MDAYSRNPPVKETGTVEHDMPKSKPTRGSMSSQAAVYRRGYGPSHGTGLADALIAATTSESGAKLVSFNRRHFPMVEITVPYER